MAWNAPPLVTTGQLATAADHNTYTRGNLLALRAGEIAITSQAALDFIYASGASQFARVAGSAAKYPRLNPLGTAWEMAQPGLSQTFRGLTLRTHPDSDVAASKVWLDHADEIAMHDGTSVLDWNDLACDVTASGAGGLDTGAEGASRWYEIHAIRKSSDGTKNLLLHRAKSYDADVAQNGGDSNISLRRTGVPTRTQLAQGFQPVVTGPVPFINVYCRKTGTPTGRVWATIEADNAGNPSGTPLATSDKLDVSLFPTAVSWARFIFRVPPTLTATTQYHLVFSGDYTTSDDVNNFQLHSLSTGAYAGGHFRELDSGVWAGVGGGTTYDLTFGTYATKNDTAVTMPTGYDQRCLVGWVYNDSGSNFKPFTAQDRHIATPLDIAVNSSTATIQTLINLSAFIPPCPVVLTKTTLQIEAAGQEVRLDAALSSGGYDGVQWTGSVASYSMDVAAELPVSLQYFYFRVTSSSGYVWMRGYRW